MVLILSEFCSMDMVLYYYGTYTRCFGVAVNYAESVTPGSSPCI